VALGRIVAIALLFGVMTCAAALAGSRTVPDSRAGEVVTARTRGAKPLTSVAAIRRARRFASSRQGRVAFAVLDREHRPRGLLRTAQFPSASVSKAMLLVAVLRRAGARHLSDGERNLLRPMITVSDNDAASAVYAQVGGHGMRRVAKAAGMRQFADVGHWAGARITAADQARLFLRIDRLVPLRHRRYARKLLSSIVGEQRWGIAPVARSARLKIFFKGGWRNGITHQVALLERGRRRLALAVLTSGSPSETYGRETIERIAVRLLD
jgi:beta-lactamase family protein